MFLEKSIGLPPVQAAGTADTPLNQGHYDEAAQSALFQQSVMEWRKARAAAKAAEAGASVSFIHVNDWPDVALIFLLKLTFIRA